MKMTHKFRLLLLALAMMLATVPAQADQFEKPTLKDIVRLLIRYGAVNIYDDHVIDTYARTNECKIYLDYYKDHFKWEKIRQKLRETIREEVSTFPTGFRYETTLKLDRYDFKRKIYPFVTSTQNKNVNTFVMQSAGTDFCGSEETKGFPNIFKMVLDQNLELQGLPLSEQEGEELFNRMSADNNLAHIVFADFNIRPVYVAAFGYDRGDGEKVAANMVARVQQQVNSNMVVIDSRLEYVDYYEDEARTKLIYRYRPALR